MSQFQSQAIQNAQTAHEMIKFREAHCKEMYQRWGFYEGFGCRKFQRCLHFLFFPEDPFWNFAYCQKCQKAQQGRIVFENTQKS
ncbi:hypothetical protein C7N83_01550 [Neisseria iguanae]|uniref:Uncharacterized protein n=1 Tax=Neisseria iguanae TaxID=90242 RepID=A0A2P7U2S0_9NEIS|nr:hypothetical protein C7N83_01550 [Neisseria iguanae]